MKRIRIIGLALLAVFALGAVVASVAQAGEFGKCTEVARKKSKYTDDNCSKESAKKEGSFEFTPTPAGSKISYTSKSGKVTLTAAGKSFTCQSSTDVGAITGSTTDEDTITFKECVLEGIKCTTGKEPAGTITTEVLETKLIDHGVNKGPGNKKLEEEKVSTKEPASGEVWLAFLSKSGITGVIAEYKCGAVSFRVTGSLSGPIKPVNKMVTKWELEFGAGIGEQALLEELNSGGGFGPPVSNVWTTEKGTITLSTPKEEAEIKAT